MSEPVVDIPKTAEDLSLPRPVVYLVSGWSGPGIEWKRSSVYKALIPNYDVKIYQQPTFGWGGIQHNACVLYDLILSDILKGKQVFGVGHSMGGLVLNEVGLMLVEQAAKLDADNEGMAGVVTIGTPHGGTPVAWLGSLISQSCRDMRPSSRTITRNWTWPPMHTLLSIVGSNDLVAPASTATHPYSDDVVMVKGGHLSMIFNSETGRFVSEFFNTLKIT